MKIDFKNKHVLITGGSRGIGNNLAKAFFLSGANVISTSTKPFKIKSSKAKNQWINFVVDFNNDDSISEFTKNLKMFNKIDILRTLNGSVIRHMRSYIR